MEGARWRVLSTGHFLVFLALLYLLFSSSYGLFIAGDMKSYQCQEGWVGNALPAIYNESLTECDSDKSATSECRKHCLARKLGLFIEGKIWVYKLLDVLKHLFPSQAGRDTVDKMLDVILECSDKHYKTYGPMSFARCYKEKKMWICIQKAAEAICASNRKQNEEAQKERSKHMDAIVKDKKGLKDKQKRHQQQIVLMDYS